MNRCLSFRSRDHFCLDFFNHLISLWRLYFCVGNKMIDSPCFIANKTINSNNKKLRRYDSRLNSKQHSTNNRRNVAFLFVLREQGYYNKFRGEARRNISQVNWFHRLVICLSQFLLNDYRNSPNTEHSENYRRPLWSERNPKRTVGIFAKLRIAHILPFQWNRPDELQNHTRKEIKIKLSFQVSNFALEFGSRLFPC